MILDQEEEELVKQDIKKDLVHSIKNQEKHDIIDYEKKWQDRNKSKLEREAEMIKAMEGLDDETKNQKIQELKRLMDAELVEEESPENQKMANFDYTKHSLTVEKDFTDLAVKIAGKLKAEKKSKLFLAFLKKLNNTIAKDFTVELHSELVENIKFIKNKKKADKKKDDKKTTTTKIPVNNNRRMDMDVNVEVNPDYKPRNHQMFDDFM